jgi:hypothetical protein
MQGEDYGAQLSTGHVNGDMSTADRAAELDALRHVAAGQRRVLTNARCLTEGIDVPVAGVVVSSGLAVAPGATDPTIEDVTVVAREGTGLRRTVCPHLVRETVILPLQADVDEQLQVWTAGYADEPSWLERDLQAAGLPPLAQLWRY